MPNRDTLRDIVSPVDLAAPNSDDDASPAAAAFAAGSRSGIQRVPSPSLPPSEPALAPDSEREFELDIATPGVIIERRYFGGYEVVIEHRGDQVAMILPGALRLVGNRDEAVDLVRALLGKPGAQR